MKKSFLFLLTLLLTAVPMLRAEELTVNDGTVGNDYVPVYGLYTDSKQITQFIIPAESLEDLGPGAIISKLTFYVKTSASVAWTSTFNVSLLEVSGTTIGSSYESLSSATLVYSGTLDATASTMDVVFTTPYVYNGGNLLVDTRNLAAGNYKSATFYGVSAPGASAESHSGSTTPTARNFLPKVTIEYTAGAPADCPNMGAPWVEEVNPTDATIIWDEVDEVELYQYVVVAKGEEPEWDEAEPIDMNLAMLEELEPATEYDFYVRTWCDDEMYGREKKLTFKTTCVALTADALPWSENFDEVPAGVLNLSCWENEQITEGSGSGSGSTGLLFQVDASTQVGNTTNKLKLPDMKAGVVTLLSLPQMTIPEADAYQFKLDVYRADASTKANEGVRIFANDQELGFISRDFATADAAHGIAAEEAAGWYTYELTIPMDGVVTIKIQGESQYGSSTYMDNLMVREIPACEKVSDIQFVSATTDAASFVWEGTSPEYALIIKQGNDTIVNTIVDSPEYTVEGLNHSTNYTYTLIVTGVCGEDLSDEVSKTISFATECVALTIPFSTDFEGLPNGSTNGLPACWNKIQPASSYYSYIYNSSTYATSGTQCLYMYGGGSSSNLYAILPAFADEVDLSAARIAFNYRSSVNSYGYSSTYYGNLVVGVMSDPTDAATFVALDTLDQKGSYVAYELYLTNAPAGYHYVALCYKPTGSASSYANYGAAYIDDVRVSAIPTCFPGTGLHAVDSLATLTSVSFGWTPNVADNLNAHVVVKNGETVIADAIVNDSVFTVTGLQSGTRYTFNIQVNTVCDGVDSPDALIGSLTMDTECEAKALPWSHSFEDAESSALPVCWTKTLASGIYPYVSTYSEALYFYGGGATSDQIVALPQVAQPLNELTLTLKYSSSVNSTSTIYGTLKVGYYADLTGEFVEVAELPQVASTTEEEVFLTNVPAEAQYLAIRYNGGESNYGSAYVYELSLTETPSCVPVKSIAFSNVERRSLDINWTPKVPVDQYDLVISDAVLSDEALAAAQVIAVEDTTGYHATGLMRDTKYYVYVRANCGAEDGASTWVVDSVETKGLEIHDQIFVNPSNGTSSTYVPVAGYYHNSYVQAIYTPADLQNYGATSISSIGLNYFSSTPMTRMVSVYMANVEESQFTSDYLRPENLVCVYNAKATTFTKGSNNWSDLTLDAPFDYAGGNLLVVFYMDYNSCETYYTSGARFYTHEASGKTRYTTSDTSTPGVLAPVNGLLSNTGTASTYRPNIRFDAQYAIDACPTVGAISHELLGDGTSSARIAWTASTGDFANKYSVLYSETPITDWSVVDAQIDSITALETVLTGLNAYTDYYVYVAAHCDGEGQNDGSSEWSEAYQFKTAADCPVVVDLAFAKTGRNTALATWKADYENKNFVYVLSTEELDEAALAAAEKVSVADTFVVFESLDYEETYYLYVAHDCGDGAYSPYLSASIQTSASCPAVVNLHATETNAYTVLVAWDSAEFAEETEWEVGVVGRESVAQVVAQKQALLIGLEAETDYTIYVKAICSEEESSALATLDVHTAAVPAAEVQIANGTSTNSYIPVYGNYCDASQKTQSIYPAAMLESLVGQTITGMQYFVSSGSSTNWSDGIFTVSLGVTSTATMGSSFVNEAMTDVYTGTLSASVANGMTVTFDQPFVYTGGNLLVQFNLPVEVGYTACNFYGATQSNDVSRYEYYGSYPGSATNKFLPKVNFQVVPQACPAAVNLAASDTTTTSVTLSWTPGAGETSWEVVVSDKALTNDELEVAEKDVLTYQLSKQYTGLTPDVDYHFYVRSLCSAEENGNWAHGTFMTLPSCNIPTEMHFENAGLDTAVIAWSGEAAQFEVIYSNGEISDTVVVSDTCCVIRGLNHSTIYTFTASVRAICDVADSSRWSAPATMKFATECAPVAALPWSESFEDFETGFNAGTPLCWNTINCNTGSSTTYPVVFVNTNTGYVHSGTQSLFFQSGTGAHAIAILPEFADDLSGAEIAFWYRNEGVSASNGTLSVGYITDITDQTSFVALQTLAQTTTFAEVVQSLATIPAGARVAFDYVGGTSDNFYLGIDDVVIRPATTCFKVSNIHVVSDSTTTHTATIAWSAPEEGGDQFKVLVKNGEDILVNNELVSDTFLVVSDLNASTTYTLSVSVNTYCGEGDESEVVTKTVSFATDCEAISAFPWSDDFEAYATGSMNNAGCYSTEALQGAANNWEIKSDASTAHSGSKYAYIKYSSSSAGRTVGALHLPEMLLEAGKNYEFKYWLKGSASGSTDTIKVFMGETVLHNFNSKNDLGGNWNEIADTIVGTGEVVTLSFSFSNLDGYFAYLDDISVKEVHVPVLTYDTAYVLTGNFVEEPVEMPYSVADVEADSVMTALVLEEVITYADGVESRRDTTYLGLAEEVVLARANNTVALEGTNNVVVTADAAGTYSFDFNVLTKELTVIFPYVGPTGFGDIATDEKAVKIVRNGQVFILRGDKIYTIIGNSVDHIE